MKADFWVLKRRLIRFRIIWIKIIWGNWWLRFLWIRGFGRRCCRRRSWEGFFGRLLGRSRRMYRFNWFRRKWIGRWRRLKSLCRIRLICAFLRILFSMIRKFIKFRANLLSFRRKKWSFWSKLRKIRRNLRNLLKKFEIFWVILRIKLTMKEGISYGNLWGLCKRMWNKM